MVKFFKTIEKIIEKYSETKLNNWYYDGLFGSVEIQGSSHETQIWNVINDLKFVDGIRKIELSLARDLDYDYDILIVEFIEKMKQPSKEELKEMEIIQ